MVDSIKLDILTPLGPKRAGIDVPGVQLPGIEGEMGVLPHHEGFVTAVVPGIVRFREGDKSVRIAVGSGFLEVKEAGRAILLVERAVGPEDVDAADVQARHDALKAELQGYKGSIADADYRERATELAWLEAQLRLVK